jgi:hypothetical protein
MLMSDAQRMVGNVVALSFRNREGSVETKLVEVFDVGFVSLNGPCLVTDHGEIRLDQLVAWHPGAAAA